MAKNPRDTATDLLKSVREEIKAYENSLVKLRTAEVSAIKKSLFGLPEEADSNKQITAKVHKTRTIFDILGKSEDYIDAKHDADPKKRFVHVGAYDNKAYDDKEVQAPGSGGKIVAGKKLAKEAIDPSKPASPSAMGKQPTLKPAGIPSAKAGSTPKPPKVPGAPGSMVKDEAHSVSKPPVGVFARLAASKAKKVADGVGTPASQNLAAAKVLTQRVMTKKPLGKSETVFDILEKADNRSAKVAALRSNGKTIREIASEMGMSVGEVEFLLNPTKKSESLDKVAPPGFDEKTMHKLKEKYGKEGGFKVAWSAHNKKIKKSEAVFESCPWCQHALVLCEC